MQARKREGPLWVTGCLQDYVGITTGVLQIADDLLQRPSRQSRANKRRLPQELLQPAASPTRKASEAEQPRGRWSLPGSAMSVLVRVAALPGSLYRCIFVRQMSHLGTSDEVSGAVADPPCSGKCRARRRGLQRRRRHARFYPN